MLFSMPTIGLPVLLDGDSLAAVAKSVAEPIAKLGHGVSDGGGGVIGGLGGIGGVHGCLSFSAVQRGIIENPTGGCSYFLCNENPPISFTLI